MRPNLFMKHALVTLCQVATLACVKKERDERRMAESARQEPINQTTRQEKC
jgi:hypothetical protein